MSPRLRCAIYARVSTRDKQTNDNQLAQLREFARVSGWEVVAEYTDEESGASPSREQYRRLFTDASRRRFDVVLFWALDRFSREGALKTLQDLARLNSYGVSFRSFTEQYLDTCGMFREAVISILATIAAQERLRNGERTRAGMARARAAGATIGRPKRKAPPRKLAEALARNDSIKRIAAAFRVSPSTAARWKRQGPLPTLKISEVYPN